MSSHRLLPSIVFASTSLLTGCGGEIDSQTIFPETPLPDASPGPVEVKPGPAKPPDAGIHVEPDARACEGGWPTTKGQICTFDAGLACCTRSFGDEADAGVICCPVGQ